MRYRTIICTEEKPVRDLLQLAAELRGHEVVLLSTPEFCLSSDMKACTHHNACSDFLLSDHGMPQLTSLEVMELLIEKGCKVPFKGFLSKWDLDAVKRKAEEMGCYLIPKPFQMRDISAWFEAGERYIDRNRELISRQSFLEKLAGAVREEGRSNQTGDFSPAREEVADRLP